MWSLQRETLLAQQTTCQIKRKRVADIKRVGVYFRFHVWPCVSALKGEDERRRKVERWMEGDERKGARGYSLTEWRLMSLCCLTKPLLIPPGLWMFRDVSNMNKRCQSSAVTFLADVIRLCLGQHCVCRSGPAVKTAVYLFVHTVCVCVSVYIHACIFIQL